MPNISLTLLDDRVEREPITVVCSEKGWIRVLKGHTTNINDLKYKEGDTHRFFEMCESTDKILLFASNGRSHGESIRMMIDIDQDDEILMLMVASSQRIQKEKLLVTSTDSRGFIVPIEQVIAQTKAGKQILTLPDGIKAHSCHIVNDDAVAIIGTNRKMLIFKIDEIPEQGRGRGVILHANKSGKLADIKLFKLKDGLSWSATDKVKTTTDLRPWLGKRGQVGRMPPAGFSRTNKFHS